MELESAPIPESQSNPSLQPRDRLTGTKHVVLFFLLPTLLLTAAVGLDLTPFLRGPGEWPPEWRWPYRVSPVIPVYLFLLVAVLCLVGFWWYRTRNLESLKLRHLVALVLLSISFILSVHLSNSRNHHTAILFNSLHAHSGQYFHPAGKIIDLSSFLHDYRQDMGTLSTKLETHPPGNVVFYWTFHRLVQWFPEPLQELWGDGLRILLTAWYPTQMPNAYLLASTMAGGMVVILTALTLFPLYFLGRLLLGHQRARQTLLLYFFMPILTMLVPTIDQVYIFLVVTALWLLYSGLVKDSYVHLFLSGLFLSLGIFMSFSLLPITLVTFLTWGLWAWRSARQLSDGKSAGRSALQLLSLFAGASIVWIFSGTNPLPILLQSLSAHQEVPVLRNYFAWLFYNPYDLLLFLGTPAAIMVFVSGYRVIRRLLSRGSPLSPAYIFFITVILSLLLLFISGIWRGETARALAYFYPLLILISQVEAPSWSTSDFLIICAATVIQNLVFYSTITIG